MIKKISIEGYKSIKKMELELQSINVLIGANGSGKSNFISYFQLVHNLYEQRLCNYTMQNNAEDLVYFGLKHTQEISSVIDCEESQYSFVLQPRANGSMFVAEEECKDIKGNVIFDHHNEDESILANMTSPVAIKMADHMKGFKYYHFHDTSKASPLRTKADIEDNLTLSTDGNNLAAILYLIKSKYSKTYKRIEMVIRSIMPYFDKFNLQPSQLDTEKIELRWVDVNSPDKYFSARDLSDGSIRFIALATLLMQPCLPELIIIDEPELGLHPQAIEKLSGLIRSAAERGCQIIIATQSADLLSNFDASCIITVDKHQGQSEFSRLNAEEVSDSFKK